MAEQIYCPLCGLVSSRIKLEMDKHIFQKFYCHNCDVYFSISIDGTTKEWIEGQWGEYMSEMRK